MFDNIKTQELPNDVLEITAELKGTAEIVFAYGWVSATTNHFSPDDYQADGNLKDGATAREMTAKEKSDYCIKLLEQALNNQ